MLVYNINNNVCSIINFFFFLGVYLFLKEVVYPNNSFITITEIGNVYRQPMNNALQCVTDLMPCCKLARIGEWYFPNGTRVPLLGDGATAFYRSRGLDGTVNLHQLNANITQPTGLYCCRFPDATGANQTLCINISMLLFFQMILIF